MKKRIAISALLLVTVFVTLNSLLILNIIHKNQRTVRSNKLHLLNKNIFIELLNCDIKKNTSLVTWVEDDEIIIGDVFYDILKVESIGIGKSRLYLYADKKDKELHLALKNQHHTKGKKQKKQNNRSLTDLLKLKCYSKEFRLQKLFSYSVLGFENHKQKTQSGYFSVIDQPPALNS